MNNNFITEFFHRLFSSNPKFFKIVQIISIVVAVATGLPSLFRSAGVDLPEWAGVIESKITAIAAIVTAIIAQLPKRDINEQ